ncbi:MAG: WbqC family protein [Bacteroidia bacterium]|nr:WbqC family protein [Bacteroidia bacterium]
MLLPTSYFPPITWMKYAFDSGSFRIESMEHFPKQTIRNRCMLSGREKQMLVVPLRGRKDKTPTGEIRLDHSQPWQRIHLRTLQAFYRRTPWFEFYEDDLDGFFKRRDEYLIDMNAALLQMLFRWLRSDAEYSVSASYEKQVPDGDLRSWWDSKKIPAAAITIPDYWKGSGRTIPADRLTSVLDLFFYEGKNTGEVLKNVTVPVPAV